MCQDLMFEAESSAVTPYVFVPGQMSSEVCEHDPNDVHGHVHPVGLRQS